MTLIRRMTGFMFVTVTLTLIWNFKFQALVVSQKSLLSRGCLGVIFYISV